MQSFTTHTGRVATMDRSNVDTDQIIPKQFLKRIERSGFGEFLFFDWRFQDDGSENPDFELNQSSVQGATILVTRDNFGSGSSREHAVWALSDFGIRALVAPSFADIFFNNCFKNSILPVVAPKDVIDRLLARAKSAPGFQLTVDLEQCRVSDGGEIEFSFEIEPSRRHSLLNGLDEISLTLEHEDKITAYERAQVTDR